MELPLTAVLVLILLAFAGLVVALWAALRKGNNSDLQVLLAQQDGLRAELQNSLQSTTKLVTSQLNAITTQVNDQLARVSSQLDASTGQMSARMDNAARAVSDVRQGLGELSKAAERIFDVGRDIASLQEILKAPKLRGGLGELFLGDILSQCIPGSYYELQYSFKTGSRVDAIVKLKDGLVPIDAKFPLENFRKTLEGTEEARASAKKRFVTDCKRHIDAIASSYILPDEGTLSFALMYIPAENVYYETIIRDETGEENRLLGYAFSKRVIPVSPNSFYAYLQTVLLGLRGMETTKEALALVAQIEGLKGDFEKFTAEFDTLGRHITNSKAKYDEAARRAERFSDRLSSLNTPAEALPPPAIAASAKTD